jgi:hypothetical protein
LAQGSKHRKNVNLYKEKHNFFEGLQLQFAVDGYGQKKYTCIKH